jgi:hypothetical protein
MRKRCAGAGDEHAGVQYSTRAFFNAIFGKKMESECNRTAVPTWS